MFTCSTSAQTSKLSPTVACLASNCDTRSGAAVGNTFRGCKHPNRSGFLQNGLASTSFSRGRCLSRSSNRTAFSKESLSEKMLEGSVSTLTQAMKESVERLGQETHNGTPLPADVDGLNRDGLDMDQGLCRALRRYDPQKVKEFAMADKFRLAMRASKIASAVSGFWIRRELLWKKNQSMPLDMSGDTSGAGGGSIRDEAAYLRGILADLGPTFVKLGQNLGNRPDLVRADYMDELCLLQDRVPPFDNGVAMAAIRASVGAPLEDVFERLSPEPVAAASLGQVYKGTLRADGSAVAVKVQRPGVEPQVLLDLYLLRYIAKRSLNEYAVKNLGVEATLLVDEFGEKLLEELDYVQEARSLMDFRRNFAEDENVKIPFVYLQYSGPRVLVMEWVDGVRCTADGAFDSEEAKRKFIRLGVESGMKQLLEFGLFHGDPHPGNVLAMANGDIGYVDFGNVAEISRMNQECLIDAMVHAMNDDYEGLANDMGRLGFLAPGTDVQPIARALRDAWADSLNGEGLRNFSFRTLTDQFNTLLYQYPIRVPERFSLVIRALLTQEGICLTLDDKFQFLEVGFPYVARRLLTDKDPALRLRLLQVVIVDGQFQWARLKYLMSLATSENSEDPGLLSKLDLGSVVVDGVKMLVRDKQLRSELLSGFRSQPIRVHLREIQGLMGIFTQIFLQNIRTWWKSTFTNLYAKWSAFWIGEQRPCQSTNSVAGVRQ